MYYVNYIGGKAVENSVFHPVQVLRPLQTGFKCSVPLNALERLERTLGTPRARRGGPRTPGGLRLRGSEASRIQTAPGGPPEPFPSASGASRAARQVPTTSGVSRRRRRRFHRPTSRPRRRARRFAYARSHWPTSSVARSRN